MDGQSNAIKLDRDSFWVEFTIGDQSFECEIYETTDRLSEIDLKHRDDASLCLKCSHSYRPTDDEYGRPELARCPNCGATNEKPGDVDAATFVRSIKPSQNFLDDVAALLRSQFGVKRCGRTEASRFYATIVDACNQQKKSIT